MIADPSFVVGSLKEAFVISYSIIQKPKENNSELLAALLADFQQKETLKQAQIKFEKKDIAVIKRVVSGALRGVFKFLIRRQLKVNVRR